VIASAIVQVVPSTMIVLAQTRPDPDNAAMIDAASAARDGEAIVFIRVSPCWIDEIR